jgi:hypothetical protein
MASSVLPLSSRVAFGADGDGTTFGGLGRSITAKL